VPFHFEPAFTRQGKTEPTQVGLVIPASAELSPALPETVRRIVETHGPPTVTPNKFGFHYVPWPVDPSLLVDAATIDTGTYTFKVKDAVVGVFELARWAHQEFCWSFSSNSQRDILAALRIGQTFDVRLDEPLEEAFYVLKYHFPSGVPNSGFGDYAVHLGVDSRPDGLRIVSAFEPESKRTESRLPFFFGFRMFGTALGSEAAPVWRELLAAAVRQAAFQRWAHCVLYTAFSLESFIDRRLADQLQAANLGEDYIEHVLRIGERPAELSALNLAEGQPLSKSAVDKLAQRLNMDVFTPRNRVAHGRLAEGAISADQAVISLKTTVEFMWDWDRKSRSLLLTPMRSSSLEAMIDSALLEACANASGPSKIVPESWLRSLGRLTSTARRTFRAFR
jgi:hypothetical protein